MFESILHVVQMMRDSEALRELGYIKVPDFQYDGSIMIKIHPCDWWKMQAESSYRLPVIAKNGRRLIDMSQLLPNERHTMYVTADAKIPRGHIYLESADMYGQLLVDITY